MSREATEPGATGAARFAPARSRLAYAALAPLVALTLAATVTGSLTLSGPSPDPPPGPPPNPAAAPPTETPTETPTGTSAPADPRSAFRDAGLRALAEPFLTAPGASCRPGEPVVNVTESVACDLGQGRIGLFTRIITADVMRDLRQGFVQGDTAEPGTVLSLRWRYVDGRPGVRTGIPAAEADPGEGVRVRFIDLEGVPRLYFDQDSCACTGYLALVEPSGDDEADLETLRSFWADPAA